MKVGLIVEGKMDHETLKVICNRLKVQSSSRLSRGAINIKKAKAYANDFLKSGYDKVIVVSDADGNEQGKKTRLEQIYENTSKDFRDKVYICVIVNELEAWLLADELALSEILNHKVKERRNPEQISQPKEDLEEIFRSAGKIYFTTSGKRIAAKMDIRIVERKCPSFKVFSDILKVS